MNLDSSRIDTTYRYAELADPGDRFSELGDPLDRLVEEVPAAFPQQPGSLDVLLGGANAELPQRTDAFQVRVQAPAGVQDAPVIIFVPGGGFLSGTGNARWVTSTGLVDDEGFVLVTVNYRLGALGHLGSEGTAAESQRGLRDILTALGWVHRHIREFGGDPDNVTLAGDSAGAWYAYALAAMADARGLFQRAALVSLPWEPPLTDEAYRARREVFGAALGRPIETAPVDELLRAQRKTAREFVGKGMTLMPATGGPITADLHDFSSSAPRLHVDEILLISTPEENAAFLFNMPEEAVSPEQVDGMLAAKFADPAAVTAWTDEKWEDPSPKLRLVEGLTLHQFRLAHLELAEAATAAGIRVALASFSVRSPLPGAHSPHCFLLPFLFNGRAQWHDAPMLDGLSDDDIARVGDPLRAWFSDFTRHGVTEAYDPAHPLRLEFAGGNPTTEFPREIELRTKR